MAFARPGRLLLLFCLLCLPQLHPVGASPIPAGGAGELKSAAPLLVRVESSSITAVADSEPTVSLTAVPTLAFFTREADHTSFSDTTSSFTSTVPITTTLSDGRVSTTVNVVTGVITTSVPVATFGVSVSTQAAHAHAHSHLNQNHKSAWSVRVESSIITALGDAAPTVSLTSVGTPVLFTGNADHTSFSDTTSSFTSTVPITTTLSDGRVSTTVSVVTGVITTSVPVATFGPNGEQVSASSPSKHSIAGFVASIVLGCLAAFLVGAATWRFIYLRRKAASRSKRIPTSGQRKSTQPESDAEVIDPFSDAFRTSWQANGGSELQSSNVDSTQPTSLTHASSISSTRQLYISNQVNRAREKVQELEELSSLLLHSARNSGVSSEAVNLEAVSQPQDGQGNESTALENRLQRAWEEIEGLNLRIHELERRRESDWALGLTDEYPPEYVE